MDPPADPPPAVVCYHYPCLDGVFAALAARLGLPEGGPRVRFVPLTVHSPPSCAADLGLEGGEHVYLLDYVGPRGFALNVAKVVRRLTVLDHHKTALDILPGRGSGCPANMDVVLDMKRSAATIAMDYFKPRAVLDSPKLRWAFRYVEDADLARWKLKNSKPYTAGIARKNLEFDFNKNPRIFDQLLRLDTAEMTRMGRKKMRADLGLMEPIVRQAFEVAIGGADAAGRDWGRCLAARADDLHHLRSGIGNRLARMSRARGLRAIGLVAYFEPEMNDRRKIKCSLRSLGREDTTKISEFFGGGGHTNASSCFVDFEAFQTWRT
ncbi:unnamed protein product [Ostreobium quekettii]|uniref:DHHA1 domain-containing protein n=1 Tax=Ostreobium quekettii TaxID=121088 RepID=A0A8S1IZ48_9CHLO|nr:unnamed protein product [Ostreobium quekettii]